MTVPADENEWNRTLVSVLSTAPPYVLIDNLPPILRSSTLAGAITANYFSGRSMGASRMQQPLVRCAWAATGNNPTLSDELRERVLPVRLDARHEHPEHRTGFRHPHLLAWLAENHSLLVWSALTLIQGWVAQGRPLSTKMMGGFEGFASVMGGVLDAVGVPGFLANPDARQNYSEQQSSAFSAFLAAWGTLHGDHTVGVAELLGLARDLELGEGDERSRGIRLGKLLREHRDRVIGGSTIELIGTYQGSQQYRLRHAGG
jgi:hypothetical protein